MNRQERRSGSDRRVTTTASSGGWLAEQVSITRGFLLSVVIVSFAFFGLGTWGAVHTVNSLREDDCHLANERRGELRDVAHDLVDNDRFLINLADGLSDDGLPEEFLAPLEARWHEQDAKIDSAYQNAPCD